MTTGALFKIRPQFHRWKNAMLREASKDVEGWYLKVDGTAEDGKVEQLYLFLTRFDVEEVIGSWEKLLSEEIRREQKETG